MRETNSQGARLKAIDVTPSKEGRKTLIEFATRELTETGRFMRVASPREAAEIHPAKKL